MRLVLDGLLMLMQCLMTVLRSKQNEEKIAAFGSRSKQLYSGGRFQCQLFADLHGGLELKEGIQTRTGGNGPGSELSWQEDKGKILEKVRQGALNLPTKVKYFK